MNHDALERLLAKHRLAGPDPDLRTRSRAQAAWRASDGDPLALQLWRFARTWGLGVAAALVLNLMAGGPLPWLSRARTASPLTVQLPPAIQEWQQLCRDLELPDVICQRAQRQSPAPSAAEEGRERQQLERELGAGG